MKRYFLFLHCQDGHKWEFVGGRNCGCAAVARHQREGCSVPVHRCSNCGDYDYGDNDDARQVKKDCEDCYGTEDQDDGK